MVSDPYLWEENKFQLAQFDSCPPKKEIFQSTNFRRRKRGLEPVSCQIQVDHDSVYSYTRYYTSQQRSKWSQMQYIYINPLSSWGWRLANPTNVPPLCSFPLTSRKAKGGGVTCSIHSFSHSVSQTCNFPQLLFILKKNGSHLPKKKNPQRQSF